MIDTDTPLWMAKVDEARRLRMTPPTDAMNSPHAYLENRAIFEDWCLEQRKLRTSASTPEIAAVAPEGNTEPTAIEAERLLKTGSEEDPGESGGAPVEVVEFPAAKLAKKRDASEVRPPVRTRHLKHPGGPRSASEQKPRKALPQRAPIVRFTVGDRIKTLPGETGKHRDFVARARKYFEPASLEESFYLADMTYSHRQLTRYCARREDFLAGRIKKRFFEVIGSIDSKVSQKKKTKYWRNGQPTEAGLELLASADVSLDEVAADVFVENLQLIGALDALIAHQRSARTQSTGKLEWLRTERQRNGPVLGLTFDASRRESDDET